MGISGSGGGEADPLPVSAYEFVLETVDKYDEKYGMTSIRECLSGSKSKNVQKYGLDKDRNYGVLKQYSQDVIETMMKALEREGYVYRTPGIYPKLGLSLK